jgi:hypothetical protein
MRALSVRPLRLSSSTAHAVLSDVVDARDRVVDLCNATSDDIYLYLAQKPLQVEILVASTVSVRRKPARLSSVAAGNVVK